MGVSKGERNKERMEKRNESEDVREEGQGRGEE